jgi:hypothetical protein
MQITGRPSRLSSVHSHVDVGPVSRPMRTASGAFDLTKTEIASGSESTTPSRATDPDWSTTQFASTTCPVRHSTPLPLSIVARPHEAGLLRSWRADSVALVWLDLGITPCCKSLFVTPIPDFPDCTRGDRTLMGTVLRTTRTRSASSPTADLGETSSSAEDGRL